MLQAGEDRAESLLIEGLSLIVFDELLYRDTRLLGQELIEGLVIALPDDSVR